MGIQPCKWMGFQLPTQPQLVSESRISNEPSRAGLPTTFFQQSKPRIHLGTGGVLVLRRKWQTGNFSPVAARQISSYKGVNDNAQPCWRKQIQNVRCNCGKYLEMYNFSRHPEIKKSFSNTQSLNKTQFWNENSITIQDPGFIVLLSSI